MTWCSTLSIVYDQCVEKSTAKPVGTIYCFFAISLRLDYRITFLAGKTTKNPYKVFVKFPLTNLLSADRG